MLRFCAVRGGGGVGARYGVGVRDGFGVFTGIT